MIPTELFDAFAQRDSIPLMAQSAPENALCPRWLDRLFEGTARRPFSRHLLFPAVVGPMSAVACRLRPSINAAYQKGAGPIPVCSRFLRGARTPRTARRGRAGPLTAERRAPAITAMGRGRRPTRGALARAPRRQSPARQRAPDQGVRTPRAGALPRCARVGLDLDLMPVVDAIRGEDGHARERPLLTRPRPPSGPVTSGLRAAIPARLGARPRGPPPWRSPRDPPARLDASSHARGRARARGRIDTGAAFEPTPRATDDAGEVVSLPRHGGPGQIDPRRRYRDQFADRPAGQRRACRGGRRFVPSAVGHRDRLSGDARRRSTAGSTPWVIRRRRCSAPAWRWWRPASCPGSRRRVAAQEGRRRRTSPGISWGRGYGCATGG